MGRMHWQTSDADSFTRFFKTNKLNKFCPWVTVLQDFYRATCRFCFSGVGSILLIVWLKLHTFLGSAARRYHVTDRNNTEQFGSASAMRSHSGNALGTVTPAGCRQALRQDSARQMKLA